MFSAQISDSDWDLAKPMLLGLLLHGLGQSKTGAVTPLLEQQGYRFVEIFQTSEDPDEPDM